MRERERERERERRERERFFSPMSRLIYCRYVSLKIISYNDFQAN